MNYRETEFYKTLMKNKDSYEAIALTEGFSDIGNPSTEMIYSGWQFLHDTGIAYKLNGWFGRKAERLVESGIIEK